MLTRTTSCRDGWHWTEQSRLVKYYHDRRYDEVIRYARRNPRNAKKNSCFEDRVRRFSGNGRRSYSPRPLSVSVSCRFLSCLGEKSKKSKKRTGPGCSYRRRFVLLCPSPSLLALSLALALALFSLFSLSLCFAAALLLGKTHLTCCGALCGCVERACAGFFNHTPPIKAFNRRTGTSITRYSYSDTYRQCLRTARSKKPERKGIKISLFHPSHSSTEPKIESNPQTTKSSKWPNT